MTSETLELELQNFTTTKYYTGEKAAVEKFSKCDPFWTYYQTK